MAAIDYLNARGFSARNQVAVLDRESVEVEASRHHNGNFTRNMVTLLAELRAGLAVFAPSAVRVLDLQPNP